MRNIRKSNSGSKNEYNKKICTHKEFLKDLIQKSLPNKVHEQGMTLLVDKVHIQEPLAHVNGYVSHIPIPIHMHVAVHGMADATLFSATYRIMVVHSHLRCGSCLCTLSTSIFLIAY